MCRLLYMNKNLFRKEELITYLAELEASNGGHGNGIGYLDVVKWQFRIKKGLKYDVEDAAKDIIEAFEERRPYNGILFHTRLTSAGGMTSEMNHPFAFTNIMLIHNGHYYHYDNLKKIVYLMNGEPTEGKSDTYLLGRILDNAIELRGVDDEVIIDFFMTYGTTAGNIFIQTIDGTVYLLVGRTYAFEVYIDGETIIAASEGLVERFKNVKAFKEDGIIKIERGKEPEIIYGELVDATKTYSMPYYVYANGYEYLYDYEDYVPQRRRVRQTDIYLVDEYVDDEQKDEEEWIKNFDKVAKRWKL